MEPGRFALYLTLILFAILCDMRILYLFLGVLSLIAIFHMLTPSKYNSTRRKLMISSWDEPREGIILYRYEADTTQVQEYIKECKYSDSMILCKVIGRNWESKIIADILENLPDCNGKIVLGKYIPYDKVDVSCLVDIDDGQDLAVALIEDANKKTVEDISEYLAEKAKKIKSHQDEVHKNQTSAFRVLPSFVIGFVLEILQMIGIDLGIAIKPLSLKRHQFGGAMLTNIGALKIKDAFAPFTPFTRVPILVTLCETAKRPIVKNDKIEIAPVTMVNFTIDHRYLDGGRVKKLVAKLDTYFADPKAYSRLRKNE